MRHIQPPQTPEPRPGAFRLFLGGSIEMGAAERWQDALVAFLAEQPCVQHLDVYNPRRDDWDASWPNDYDFAPFREQVEWELRAQKDADLIVYYFATDTLSPITLLDLGLFHSTKPVIGFDPAYKRAGNLLVTKDHFEMDIHSGWDNFTKALALRLAQTIGENVT